MPLLLIYFTTQNAFFCPWLPVSRLSLFLIVLKFPLQNKAFVLIYCSYKKSVFILVYLVRINLSFRFAVKYNTSYIKRQLRQHLPCSFYELINLRTGKNNYEQVGKQLIIEQKTQTVLPNGNDTFSGEIIRRHAFKKHKSYLFNIPNARVQFLRTTKS